jgi:predicted enzyme related to lactoylglutathione lyase
MADNPICWWEIQTPDLEQAKGFYGGVFGWTFKSWGDDFLTAYVDDTMVGGLRQKEGAVAGRGIHVCFRIEDTLEQTLERVEKHGGTVTVGRTEIAPEMGWYATVQDPAGVKFDLWTGEPAVS